MTSLSSSSDHCSYHRFPTRRSSDLAHALDGRYRRRPGLCPYRVSSSWYAGFHLEGRAEGARGQARAAADQHAGASEVRARIVRSEEHTSELQSHSDIVCSVLLKKKN